MNLCNSEFTYLCFSCIKLKVAFVLAHSPLYFDFSVTLIAGNDGSSSLLANSILSHFLPQVSLTAVALVL